MLGIKGLGVRGVRVRVKGFKGEEVKVLHHRSNV
jgi:hypothetical protein